MADPMSINFSDVIKKVLKTRMVVTYMHVKTMDSVAASIDSGAVILSDINVHHSPLKNTLMCG